MQGDFRDAGALDGSFDAVVGRYARTGAKVRYAALSWTFPLSTAGMLAGSNAPPTLQVVRYFRLDLSIRE